MIKVSMNIGGSTGPYTNIPIFLEFENAREFTCSIRRDIFNILLWSHERYGSNSNMWLGMHIEEDKNDDTFYWDFIVYCKNIREFKKYIVMHRDEIDALKSEAERDEKISNLLDS